MVTEPVYESKQVRALIIDHIISYTEIMDTDFHITAKHHVRCFVVPKCVVAYPETKLSFSFGGMEVS